MVAETELYKEKEEDYRVFGRLLPFLPLLLFKLGTVLLRFKNQAKKGGRVFRNELQKQGIDEQTANELTEIYLEASTLRNYVYLLQKNS